MEFVSIENGRAVLKFGINDMNDVIQCFAKEISDLESFGDETDKKDKRERLVASRKLLGSIYNDVKTR